MKTILLLLFTMHQTFFFSSALKCYECAGDCKSPKEVDCAADIKCCYSSVAAVGGGAAGGGAAAGETTVTPTAAPPPRMKRDGRSSPPAIRRGMTAEYLQDEAAAAPSTEAPAAAAGDAGASGGAGAAEHPAAADKEGEGGENEHKYKGCCEESITKDTCPNDEHCYLCEGDLCNKESTSSASAVLASILNTLLPLAIIGGVIGSHEIFII